MPTPESDDPSAIDPAASGVACPFPLTPPPDADESRDGRTNIIDYRRVDEEGMAPNATDDNTGAGMRQAQEDSMYQQMEEEPREEIQRQEDQPMSPVSPRESESVKNSVAA